MDGPAATPADIPTLLGNLTGYESRADKTIRFAFLDVLPDLNVYGQNSAYFGGIDPDTGQPYFDSFAEAERTAAEQIFIGLLSRITDFTFVLVDVNQNPDIRLGIADFSNTPDGNLGGATFPPVSGITDIYIDRENRSMTVGLAGYYTLLHEIGHALGLKDVTTFATAPDPYAASAST
jgi:hypothetical protein